MKIRQSDHSKIYLGRIKTREASRSKSTMLRKKPISNIRYYLSVVGLLWGTYLFLFDDDLHEVSLNPIHAPLKQRTRYIRYKNGVVEEDKLIVYEYDTDKFCHMLDFETFYTPCESQFQWKKADKRLRTKAKFSIVEVFMPLAEFEGEIRLQTFDQTSKPKTNGGDFWRAIVKSKYVRLAVQFKDLLNGNYVGKFILPKADTYSIEIYLETSQCEGMMDPPSFWFSSGK